jgi:hypothetical protein
VSRPAAAAAPSDTAPQTAFTPVFYDPATSTNWHFIIANADFMLNDENNEHFPEVLRERRRYFLENQAPVNFFLVTNPKWLADMPAVAKQVRQPAVALVSPDAAWITCVCPLAPRSRRVSTPTGDTGCESPATGMVWTHPRGAGVRRRRENVCAESGPRAQHISRDTTLACLLPLALGPSYPRACLTRAPALRLP